jgi:hypothetical protein
MSGRWRFGPLWFVILAFLLGAVGTVREIVRDPAWDIEFGPFRFNLWLTVAAISLYIATAGAYLRARRARDELAHRAPPNFRISVTGPIMDVGELLQNSATPPDLDVVEAGSLYMPLSIFVTNRGPVTISLTLRVKAQWKDGEAAFCHPLGSKSKLGEWIRAGTGGEETPVRFPLNVPPHTSAAGWVGYIILPMEQYPGRIADVGHRHVTVTEHISGASQSFEIEGEWDARP